MHACTVKDTLWTSQTAKHTPASLQNLKLLLRTAETTHCSICLSSGDMSSFKKVAYGQEQRGEDILTSNKDQPRHAAALVKVQHVGVASDAAAEFPRQPLHFEPRRVLQARLIPRDLSSPANYRIRSNLAHDSL